MARWVFNQRLRRDEEPRLEDPREDDDREELLDREVCGADRLGALRLLEARLELEELGRLLERLDEELLRVLDERLGVGLGR